MRFAKTFVLLAALLAGATAAHAQRFFEEQQLTQNTKVTFSSRIMYGVEGTFSNVGEIRYPEDDDGVVELVFNDGYINKPTEQSTKTSDFGFEMDNATTNAEGEVSAFTLNRYRSLPGEDQFSDDSGLSHGWEFTYQYEFGHQTDRLRFGLMSGLAMNDLDVSTSVTATGTLLRQQLTIEVDGGIIFVPNSRYTGGDSGPQIEVPGQVGDEEEVVQDRWDGDPEAVPALVDADMELDGVLANFRLGPTVSYRPFENIFVNAAIGASGIFYGSTFTTTEVLTNSLLAQEQIESSSESTGEFLYGYFGELSVVYNLNEQTSVHLGVQYFGIVDNPSGTSEESEVGYELDLQDGFVVTTGIGYRY